MRCEASPISLFFFFYFCSPLKPLYHSEYNVLRTKKVRTSPEKTQLYRLLSIEIFLNFSAIWPTFLFLNLAE